MSVRLCYRYGNIVFYIMLHESKSELAYDFNYGQICLYCKGWKNGDMFREIFHIYDSQKYCKRTFRVLVLLTIVICITFQPLNALRPYETIKIVIFIHSCLQVRSTIYRSKLVKYLEFKCMQFVIRLIKENKFIIIKQQIFGIWNLNVCSLWLG